MSEGSIDAPVRRPIAWKDPEFYDPLSLDAEMRRQLDVCHGCRRCFNLCDSFPKLFDLIDDTSSGELEQVSSKSFKEVVDACTLCDMCFLTKCPYVPPHDFELDIPHLFLRYRAVEMKQGKVPLIDRQLTETDRNGKLGCAMPGVVNWATRRDSALARKALEAIAGIDARAGLPRYATKTLCSRARTEKPKLNEDGPAKGRKAVIYATCFGNYNIPEIGMAARAVLAHNGVETEVVYPGCCGMPQMEHGDLERVAGKATRVAAALAPWIDQGWDVISLVASCSLMMKNEWPLIVPDDPNVKMLAAATYDISEYVADIARKEGVTPGLKSLEGPVAIHIACHSRAQNMGRKASEMLNLIPKAKLTVMERCSGHGGSWGVKVGNHDIALKVGRPVARQVAETPAVYLVSECPLARDHILDGVRSQGGDVGRFKPYHHPIQVLAEAWGL